MAITQRGSTTVGKTSPTGSSVNASKPTGTVSGDVLIALVTSNDDTISPPAGWTLIAKDDNAPTPGNFGVAWYYKVAGGSEGSSYTFTAGGSNAAPSMVSIMSWIGVDNADPIAGSSLAYTSGNAAEGLNTPGCTNTDGAAEGRVIHSRSARRTTTGGMTFTGSGTELEDDFVAGTSVSYSHAIYCPASDFISGENAAAIAITASQTEDGNFAATLILAADLPATAPTPTTATASGTANNPTVIIGSVNPTSADAAATAGNVTANIASGAGVAAAAATADNPAVATGAPGGNAAASATALNPTTTGQASSAAGVAEASAEAQGPALGFTLNVGVAVATASAINANTFMGSPPYRTYKFEAESRTLMVDDESRSYQVARETRVIAIGWDDA